ncbi:hypothetical protein EHO61_14935 [Leptospira fluminis]|uniref:Uncharacterized protein n=1 Tax=Leptospira fluminis TaxID=2484979 RepID=A0A4R9GLY0_9LEPT|nr:hypothetical protein [Leptospira fluminis]TGK15645.1 hypothetical protein EHO61_14935 [Leptospira fluminis]
MTLKYRKGILLTILICLCVSNWNCAIFNRNNTPLVVRVEKHLVPEEPVPKVLAAPFYLPVGLAAGLLDLFIVHPIIRIPDAYRDTISALWTPHPENGYMTRMAFLPFSVLLTPLFFAGDLFFRSAFDVNGNVDRARIEVVPEKKVKSLQQALSEGDRATIVKSLNSYTYYEPGILYAVLEAYPSDEEIRQLAFVKLVSALNAQTFPQFEDFLLSQLNKDARIDRMLLGVFRRLSSKKASAEILRILRIGSVPEALAKDYMITVIYIGNEKELQYILDRIRSDKIKDGR